MRSTIRTGLALGLAWASLSAFGQPPGGPPPQALPPGGPPIVGPAAPSPTVPAGPGTDAPPPAPPPPGHPDAWDGPPGDASVQPPLGPPFWRPAGVRGDPLLRLVGARRPDLARRLAELRERSPARFREVVAEAFLSRLEEALDRAEGAPSYRGVPGHSEDRGPRGGRPGFSGLGPGGPPGPGWGQRGPSPLGPPPVEDEAVEPRVRELERRVDELERQTRELVERTRGAREADRPAAREELRQRLREQFELRGELRKLHVGRMERQLRALQDHLERVRQELRQREAEREAIIERRLESLLSEERDNW